MAWRVKVARGQREHAIPVVQEAYRAQQQFSDREAAFVLVAQAHLTHAMSFSDDAFYQNARVTDSMRCSLRCCRVFFLHLTTKIWMSLLSSMFTFQDIWRLLAPAQTLKLWMQQMSLRE